ncbi:MAG: hypothetical protein K2W92_02260, partial [Alphaproteobacteria bacterium]|nr:hypothetical protein [Alphaproteobacteria bacterium]
LRYKETHGEKPTSGQIESMVQISREIEKRDYAHSSKGLGSHEVEFLRRKEGDLLLRSSKSLEFMTLSENKQIKAQISLKVITHDIIQEVSKINQREISL